MSLHVYWPATAALTLFVVGVIMLMLKRGEIMQNACYRLGGMCGCKCPEKEQEWDGRSYSRDVSVSIS